MSPGDRARNQIYYIMVKKRWRTSLQNVKTRPGADCGSDHQLLVAKLRLRLKAKKCDSARTRYDVENIPSQFSVEVKNKFELLLRNDEAEQTPNELWEDMKETVENAAKNHIPKKRKRKQPWISNQTFDIADDRKRAKAKRNRGEWTRLNKAVTSSVKEDKRKYIEGKCEDLERHKNNSKAAFAIVKEITKKRIPRLDVIHDENGITLTENEDIKERWVQYSTKLFAAQEQVDTQ